ncbi:glutamate receptor ionotropic, kainate 2 isoform X1 [Folsomia candida]|uniref:glutamate receptor ionotropic, kainate 2 isoform X1 n=1 Tax=Folsomia candida TaxID=158441 RepID=UPI000B8FA782|nr:glutamate receptor ionotropic, kainate 2 isoform X1 [Folsomia candida]
MSKYWRGDDFHRKWSSLSWLVLTLYLLDIQHVTVRGQYSYQKPVVPYENSGLPDVIRVGGLFDEGDTVDETAFKHAVDRVTFDATILPRRRLSPQIERITPGDSFHAAEKACDMMSGGIAAIFGPQSAEGASHIQSICDAFELPHIETKWDYKIRKENYLINLAPHPATISRAINDLVESYGWVEYVILYENNESLFRLQDLIKATQPPARKASLRQLSPDDDFRGLLKDILRATQYRKIVIDCSTVKLAEFFKQAQQVGLMNYQFSYIVTTLDLHTLNLEDYQHGDINITAFRMLDPDKPEVQSVVRQWNNLLNTQGSRGQAYNQQSPYYYGSKDQARQLRKPMANPVIEDNFQMMKTETALVYDAVHLFSKALHVLDSSQRIDIRPLTCESTDTWQHGYSIINYMKMVQLQGLTGLIQFDTSGYRSDIQLDVIQVANEGLIKIGIWDSKFVSREKFSWSRPEVEEIVVENESMDLRNRTLVISTLKNDPFCMFKLSKVPLRGNDQYEGYSVDLAQKLSEILGFKYKIHIVSDGKYGSHVGNGVWNGMIKEILDGTADLAIADLTINNARETAVDFSMPYMNLGISILHTKPMAKPPSLFSFLSPFSIDVWIYMCFAFFGVSIIMFIIARITPYEWVLTDHCCNNKKVNDIMYINDLSLFNALWVIMGGLFRQKPNIYAKATSTRMIAGIWWFFTLIMVSSYTANLASFLIVQDLEDTIKSLDDLPKQNKVKYGCVGGGSTAAFFKNSEFTTQKQIAENMDKFNTFVNSNFEGVERVKNSKGKYAFFVENTVLEYITERNCELTQVGGMLDSKGYGVALPKNSKYRQAFNSAILQLQEKGTLDDLKRKWWKEERKGAQCVVGGSSESNPLALDNVGGVFVVLVGGCIFAVVVCIFEFFIKTRQTAKSSGGNVKEALSSELKFALAFSGDSKPVLRKKDSISSQAENETAMGSQYLDLGLDSYGFPKPVNRQNGGVPPDGFT